ncbi:unnamed protein product [Merluccius merluccius]
METEQSSHETEESLILAQFGTIQNPDAAVTTKLHNGTQSPEGAQINGHQNWNHYKPSAGVNSVKRTQENCGSPGSAQGLFSSGPYTMNGELKHALPDDALLVHQPKKLKMDSEMKGNEDISSSLVEDFPELTKATDFNCNALQETKLDKINSNFSNGDIFCHSRQPFSISNGATASPPTMEGTPGDLLEKTLSQYYPEQVSIAPQPSGSLPVAVNGSLAKKLPNQGAQHLSLSSGYPNSTQMPASLQQKPRQGHNNENGYNPAPYIVNGYSSNYEAEHRQQQPYPGQERDFARGQVEERPANGSQHQNDLKCYPKNSDGMYKKSNQEFNQNSFPEHNMPTQAGKGCESEGFPKPGLKGIRQSEEPGSAHQSESDGGLQYNMQPQMQHFQQHSGSLCRAVPDSIGSMGPNSISRQNAPGTQQSHHAGIENGLDSQTQQSSNLSCTAPGQGQWMNRNTPQSEQRSSSGPPSKTQEQDMWEDFLNRPQSDQQPPNPKANGQMLETDPVQNFQTQEGFTDNTSGSNNFQQQQMKQEQTQAQSHCAQTQHNTAPEWQQSNSKTTPMQQALSQQCNLSDQTSHCYRTPMQREPLHDVDPDLQEILSPEFLPTQQHCLERPMSHPPQFEGQQLKSPNYRPHSQPHSSQQQFQPNQQGRNSVQSNIQHSQQSDQAFGYSNAVERQQHQRQQFGTVNQGNGGFKQCHPQQQQPTLHCHQANHTDFQNTTVRSNAQIPQGTLNQQVSGQMYPKEEQQQQKDSCSQLQRGYQIPLGHGGNQGDFQKHAALRMHLLQRQERHGPPYPPQSIGDKQGPIPVKMENGPRFASPGIHQQEYQRREMAMGNPQVKQEFTQSMCKQSNKPGSILATMEQSLRQYQLSPVFEKKSFVLNSPQVKVESSGAVTILSTNADLGGGESGMTSSPASIRRPNDFTPKKEPSLQSFIESPMKLLDTPIKNLLDTPIKTQYDIASCHCVEQISEKDEGPYYTHLGAAPSVPAIREVMEKRSGLTGPAIRIEKVIYTGKEGKSTQGCPIAKWVIRRGSAEEKLLVLVRQRAGHTCETSCVIVVLLIWEGIPRNLADHLYLELSSTLTKHGAHTQRRCSINEERTCACQGLNPEACGASFSFGCSWSMYYNGCKFARSKIPRKFKLLGDDSKEEGRLEQNLQNLATLMGPIYKSLAPEAYGNQVEHEHRAPDCRLGQEEGRPFSGVTACVDFCAHAHRDLHNMQGGSTVVCTLTREDNRDVGKIPDDEQLHVLPLYKPSNTDEFGSVEGHQEKIKTGAIQVLNVFRRQVRMLSEPAKSCRQKKLEAKKAAANKNAGLDIKTEKNLQAKPKAGTYENITQSAAGPGPIPGAMAAAGQAGPTPHQLGVHPQQLQQQQHANILPTYPGSPHPASYPGFSIHSGSFPSTSKAGGMYSTPTTSPYPSPLHVPNSYMNGANSPYPGYQCNGGMPLDNYHPYYASNPKHLDIYRQQRPALYPEQQYGVHQRYPPRYGEPGLQVNGYSACSMRPGVHPMGTYPPYGPNGATNAHLMDALSRAPSTHPGLNYEVAMKNGNQFGGYPNPYLPQSPQMFPPGQDPFRMPIKQEMGLPGLQVLPPALGSECLTPQPQFGVPNGNLQGANIKQEPGTPNTPTTPQKPEMWSDNEHNFLDPDIGGVAVAPSHGSILIECAKRELHATTPVKNPDRNHPTRISLVFYQHKNMNEAKHGLALWEAKMAEKAREKEEDAERNGGEVTPSKSGGKKGVKREHPESSDPTREPPYKRFIQTLLEGSVSSTTNTYVSTAPYAFTKVTGPYSQFV